MMISVDEINKLQADNKRLNDIIDSYQPMLEELKELKAENDRLKAPSMIMPKVKQLAVPIDEYQKALKILTEGLNKRQMILQEIKTIVETCLSGVNCTECPLTNECKTDYEIEALGVCQMILQKLTKAEEVS